MASFAAKNAVIRGGISVQAPSASLLACLLAKGDLRRSRSTLDFVPGGVSTGLLSGYRQSCPADKTHDLFIGIVTRILVPARTGSSTALGCGEHNLSRCSFSEAERTRVYPRRLALLSLAESHVFRFVDFV